jgi:hypothetical protein
MTTAHGIEPMPAPDRAMVAYRSSFASGIDPSRATLMYLFPSTYKRSVDGHSAITRAARSSQRASSGVGLIGPS